MKGIEVLRRVLQNLEASAASLAAIQQRIANQSDLLNRRLEEIVVGLDHQSHLVNRSFEDIRGLDRQSDLLNRKLERIIAHVDRQSGLFRDKIDEFTAGLSRQSDQCVKASMCSLEPRDPQKQRARGGRGSTGASAGNREPDFPRGNAADSSFTGRPDLQHVPSRL